MKKRLLMLCLLTLLMITAASSIHADTANQLDAPVITLTNTAKGITVEWNSVKGAAGYRVLRIGPGEKTWQKIAEVTAKKFVDVNVESGTRYTYTVRCLNDSGKVCSPFAAYKRRVFIARPVLKSVVSTANGVTVKWGQVEGAAKYRVYRKLPGETNWKKVGDTTETAYEDTTAVSGTKYVYSARCIDSGGILRNTYAATMQLIYRARPDLPSAVNSPEGITISWEPVNGAAAYRIYRKGPKATLWNKIGDTADTSFTDTNVTALTEYRYAVRCLDEGGVLRNTYSESVTIARTVNDQTVYTSVPTVTLYRDKSNDAEAISVPYMTELTLLEFLTEADTETGRWIAFDYKGETWYAWRNPGREIFVSEKSDHEYETSTVYQREVIDLGLSFLEKPTGYRLSSEEGTSTGEPDENGVYWFDCSGLAAYLCNTVMRQYVPTYGITVDVDDLYEWGSIYNPNTDKVFSAQTVIPQGEPLDLSLLQAGDLLFFNHKKEEGRTVDHVAVYLGKGEILHATTSFAVVVSVLKDANAENFVGAIRVLPEEVLSLDQTMYPINSANMFERRGGDSDPILTIETQEPVTVLFTDNYGWCYADYKGQKGFIYLERLTDQEPVIINETRYVAKTNVNLYSNRDATAGQPFITAMIGEEVTYRGRYGTTDFYRVTYQGEDYYIYTLQDINDYISTDLEAVLAAKSSKAVIADSWLRSSMSAEDDSNKIMMLEADTVLGVAAVSPSGNWAYVIAPDGSYGFILTERLTDELPEIVNETRYVARTNINLYEQRNATAGQPCITVLIGEEVTYRGRYGSSNFYRVTYQGQDYYVYTQKNIDEFVSPDLESILAVKESKAVAADSWLRSSMSTADDSNKIVKLKGGTVVGVAAVSPSGNWAYVKAEDGTYGFILTERLTEIPEPPET